MESNLEKKIGHVFRSNVLNTKNGIHPSRVLEKNINMACHNELLSNETEIVKTNQRKCASSQSYHLTCHHLTNNCLLDEKHFSSSFRLVGPPL